MVTLLNKRVSDENYLAVFLYSSEWRNYRYSLGPRFIIDWGAKTRDWGSLEANAS